MKEIFIQFLKYYRVKFTRKYIDRLFDNLPNASSFWGLKNMLCRYSIKCECVHFNTKDLTNEMVPSFVIYHGDVSIIKGINHNVELLNSDGSEKIIPLSKFIKEWDGNAVLTNVDEGACEPDYSTHIKRERINKGQILMLILVGSFLLTKIIYGLFEEYNVLVIAILLLNILGFIVSILLLTKKYNFSNKILDRICKRNATLDCDNVIGGRLSNIYNLFNLSEACISFYVTNVAFLLFKTDYMSELSVYLYMAIPITFWSVYVQAVRLKFWCTLCLSISFIIWTTGVLFLFLHMPADIIWSKLICLGASYLFTLLFCSRCSSAFEDINGNNRIKKEFNALKLSKQVLSYAMQNSRQWDMGGIKKHGINFGPIDSDIIITVISNPFCKPCAKLHRRLNEIKNSFIKVQYIFVSLSDEMKNVNQNIISSYYKYGEKETWRLLSKWFESEKKDLSFFSNLDLDIGNKAVIEECVLEDRWIKAGSFIGTPTILVNGIEVQWPYVVEDYILYYDYDK